MPNARIAGVTLTGFHGYKAVAAMGKPLELDGRNCVLRRQEGGCTYKSNKPLFHTFPYALMRCIVLSWFSESMNFRQRAVPIWATCSCCENALGRRRTRRGLINAVISMKNGWNRVFNLEQDARCRQWPFATYCATALTWSLTELTGT